MKKISCVVLLALLAVSCVESQHALELLDRAEGCMSEHPDSARLLLETVERRTFRTRDGAARYALLYSQALDKTGVDVDLDSLIRHAVARCDKWTDSGRRALAWYYYARVLQNAKHYDKALGALYKAEEASEETDDEYLKGLIADCRGSIYNTNGDPQHAIPAYDKAAGHYLCVDRRRNVMNVYGNLAKIYAKLSEYDRSLDYAFRVKELAESMSDTVAILSSVANIAYFMKDTEPERALEMLRKACMRYYGEIPVIHYPLTSATYLALGDYEKARRYAEGYLEKNRNRAGIYPLLGNIERVTGEYKKSSENLQRYITMSDSLQSVRYKRELYEIDRRYRYEELQRELLHAEELSRTRRIVFSLVFALVVAVLAAVIIQRQKQILSRDERIRGYKERISAIEDYCETLNKMKEFQTRRNLDNQSVIDNQLTVMTKLLSAAGNNKAISAENCRMLKIAYRNCKVDDKEIVAVFRSVFDLKYPGVTDRLKESCPTFTDDDTTWYSLICLGCSASVLTFIFNTTQSYVYNKRMALRRKLDFTNDSQSFSEHLKQFAEEP